MEAFNGLQAYFLGKSMLTSKDTVLMKVVSIISAFVLVVGVFPITARAATILSDSFGTGSTSSTVSGWTEGVDGAEVRASGSGNDSVSPNGGRFAIIFGTDGYICRTVTTTGYNSVQLSYYWRGDDDSGDSSDDGIVEFKAGSVSCSSSGWTQLQNHDLRQDSSWTTQSVFTNAGFNNTTFTIRFRTDTNHDDEHFRIDGVSITGNAIVVDTDADGVADSSDNCPSTSNANQANNDGDSQGDACDTDDDNDTVADTSDNCDFDANLDQLDSDGDNVGNECDETPYTEEQLCNQAEGYWNGSDCEEISVCDENEEYNSETNECDTVEVPPTDEEICIENGDNWIDGECYTDEEVCVDAGDHWIDGECIADSIICDVFGQLGIPMPDQCEEEPTDEEVCEAQDGMVWNGEECVEDGEDGEECEFGCDGCEVDCGEGEDTQDENNAPAPKKSGGHINAVCEDMVDNDNDGLYDANDPGCENKSDSSEVDPVGGDVAGASCSAVLSDYLGIRGKENNPQAVKMVQTFLNKELGLTLEVNGVYDAATIEAVKAFQEKYSSEVLGPWGISDATGIVFKTTQRMINKISCPGLDIPMPELN